MDKKELFKLLNNAQEDIETEMREKFDNSKLHDKYEKLVELTIFDDKLDDEIIKKIDFLIDSMDRLNFDESKTKINELKEILKEE